MRCSACAAPQTERPDKADPVEVIKALNRFAPNAFANPV